MLLALSLSIYMHHINSIYNELFSGHVTDGKRAKRLPLLKICHTFPAMMKLDTVISYPKKNQKMYELRDKTLEVC